MLQHSLYEMEQTRHVSSKLQEKTRILRFLPRCIECIESR